MRKGAVLVAGAGGFIGGHLVGELVSRGHHVRGVDIKPLASWHQRHLNAENLQADLSLRDSSLDAARGMEVVYNLASNAGGMGFIERNRALCMLSVLINTHLLLGAREAGVRRYFFASSACVYAADKQNSTSARQLKETDAYPAMPEDGYGWEKLFGERMCRHFREDFGLDTRIARYHNVYGPHCTWDGGREKAPAAICRKVIAAKRQGARSIDIWGNGRQTRSFMYIDDCIAGTMLLMDSDVVDPINLGTEEAVSIDSLVDVVEDLAGTRLERRYDVAAPTGVAGRNSDNTMIRARLGWAPSIALRSGVAKTYDWIYEQMTSAS
jgi:nucleoside-diphosphate-sugar epimerase